MNKALIKLAYRQIIDIHSTGDFEKKVFNDTWEEFNMQAQVYDQGGTLKTFQQLVAHNPKANSLHYKVGFAIGLYVKELNTIIPEFRDSLDRITIPFETYRFEIIQSDITNKAEHKVAVLFITDTLTLLGNIGDYLLLSHGDQLHTIQQEGTDTFLLQLKPGLSIVRYRQADSIEQVVSQEQLVLGNQEVPGLKLR